MLVVWQIASHVGFTLIAVVGLALRIEHRLTKIETDVTWLKRNATECCRAEAGSDLEEKGRAK